MQPASHAANHLTSSRLLTKRTWSAAASLNNLLLSPAKVCPYFVYLVQRLDLDLDLDLGLNLNLDSAQPPPLGAKFKIPSFRKVNSIEYRPMQKRPGVCPSLTDCNNTSAREGSTTLRTATTANQPADPVPAARQCLTFSCRRSKQIGLLFEGVLQVGGVGMGVGTLQPQPGATSLLRSQPSQPSQPS